MIQPCSRVSGLRNNKLFPKLELACPCQHRNCVVTNAESPTRALQQTGEFIFSNVQEVGFGLKNHEDFTGAWKCDFRSNEFKNVVTMSDQYRARRQQDVHHPHAEERNFSRACAALAELVQFLVLSPLVLFSDGLY